MLSQGAIEGCFFVPHRPACAQPSALELHESPDAVSRIVGGHAPVPDEDGQLIEGVEVFRQLYARVGFERMTRLSRLPVLASVAEAAYAWFARHRLRLTGRCADDACTPRQAAARARRR